MQEGLNERKAYYDELVASAEAFRPPELQRKIALAHVLVAGAGSIGNPFAMIAARSGVNHITVADPDAVEVSNLSRQEYTTQQVGTNKAEATVGNLATINWTAQESFHAVSDGITESNVAELVANADFILDGIDVGALDMIYALHREAAKQHKPVFIGYDLAGTAMVVYCPYDKRNIEPFNGELNEEKMRKFEKVRHALEHDEITKAQFIDFIYDIFTGPISPFDIPAEQLRELINRDPEDERSYQLGTTARMVSVLTMEAIIQMLDGQEINEKMRIDLPSIVRKRNPSLIEMSQLWLRAYRLVRKRGQQVQRIAESLNLNDSMYVA